MKAILRLTATVALMLVVATGMAKEPKLSIVTVEEAKVLIFEWDTHGADTFIQIVDMEGNIIYTENVSNTAVYAKKFDLGNLEEGSYLLRAENPLKEITYGISIDDEVKVMEKKEKSKPVFRTENDRVYLNFLNLENRKVDLKIVDGSNQVVFKDYMEEEMVIEKAFNFENAYEDTYTLILNNGGDVYYKSIVVN